MNCNKVALCFSGQLRTYKVAMPYLLKYFSNFDADVFRFAWTPSNESVYANQSKKNQRMLSKIINCSQHTLKQLHLRRQPEDMKNFEGMLYGIYYANLLKTQYEIENQHIYDLVIKCRYDCLFPVDEKFPHTSIESRTIGYSISSKGWVYSDYGHFGISDIIFWGDSHSMDIASDTYKYFKWTAITEKDIIIKHGLDPKDYNSSCGVLIYNQCAKHNLFFEKTFLNETLWRTSAQKYDPKTQMHLIKDVYNGNHSSRR